MRIGLFLDVVDPGGPPYERLVWAMVQRLLAEGHEVTVLAQAVASEADEAASWPDRLSVRCWRKPKGRLLHWDRMLSAARWAQRILNREGFDLTLSLSPLLSADAVVALRGWWGHRWELRQQAIAGRLQRAVQGWRDRAHPALAEVRRRERSVLADPRVRLIVTPGEAVSDWIRRRGGRSRPLVQVTTWPSVSGVETDAAAGYRRQVREGFGIADTDRALLFATTDPLLDGASTLIDAIAGSAWLRAHTVLMMAGEVGYAEHVHVVRQGLRDRARFIYHTRQYPALYAAADVTVIPTWFDPWGQTMRESLESGTPVLTTRRSSIAPLLQNADADPAGIVIDQPGDASTLAKALEEMCDDQRLPAMATSARRVSQVCDTNAFMQEMLDWVRQARWE